MSMIRRFTQLDVFTATPLLGNPLAVVHDADGLSDAEMAAFARWTNLSETTFLLNPTDSGADYQVRIFTPQRELPFAGHPTLGSCRAWLAAGGLAKKPGVVVQQCAAGLIRVRQSGQRLAFAAPPCTRTGPLEPAVIAQICRVLRLKFRLGLFENPYTDETLADQLILRPDFRELALQVAQESMVLLKNEGDILPLPRSTGSACSSAASARASASIWLVWRTVSSSWLRRACRASRCNTGSLSRSA